ncbi:hypothetical protein NQ314_011733 [Rhamnusium bicolor]|uniref:Uncharacterized protein n=1 Tax=Rhamnusium bicolor TaxID=1586634 RepID=A0AAV8XGN0_9CUCU|nr:hypothetical protein NQ314_011733 [Rhamnusium bicolor]
MKKLNTLQTVLEKNNYYNMTSVMDAISPRCDEMLVYCLWNKDKISCQNSFKKSLSSDGFCCSFNYQLGKKYPTLYSPYSGLSTSLRVLLNPILQSVHYTPMYQAGFKVING